MAKYEDVKATAATCSRLRRSGQMLRFVSVGGFVLQPVRAEQFAAAEFGLRCSRRLQKVRIRIERPACTAPVSVRIR